MARKTVRVVEDMLRTGKGEAMSEVFVSECVVRKSNLSCAARIEKKMIPKQCQNVSSALLFLYNILIEVRVISIKSSA